MLCKISGNIVQVVFLILFMFPKAISMSWTYEGLFLELVYHGEENGAENFFNFKFSFCAQPCCG